MIPGLKNMGRGRKWVIALSLGVVLLAVSGCQTLSFYKQAIKGQYQLLAHRQPIEKLIADPRIRCIAEPPGMDTLWVAFSKRDDKSHLLWTDDYMAAFAQAANAEFVTFDRAFSKRYGSVRTTCLR